MFQNGLICIISSVLMNLNKQNIVKHTSRDNFKKKNGRKKCDSVKFWWQARSQYSGVLYENLLWLLNKCTIGIIVG